MRRHDVVPAVAFLEAEVVLLGSKQRLHAFNLKLHMDFRGQLFQDAGKLHLHRCLAVKGRADGGEQMGMARGNDVPFV